MYLSALINERKNKTPLHETSIFSKPKRVKSTAYGGLGAATQDTTAHCTYSGLREHNVGPWHLCWNKWWWTVKHHPCHRLQRAETQFHFGWLQLCPLLNTFCRLQEQFCASEGKYPLQKPLLGIKQRENTERLAQATSDLRHVHRPDILMSWLHRCHVYLRIRQVVKAPTEFVVPELPHISIEVGRPEF